MTFFAELKRRNVIRVGAAYVVVAWLVIQVVETIFPAFGFGDVAVRYTTIVFAIGFIPALIFAWAFELTPDGLKKESEVDRSQSVTPQTGKKLDRMIMVGLAVSLGYFAFDKFVLDPQREAAKDEQKAVAVEQARQAGRTEALVESYGDKSIAVLAFGDMSQAGDQEYLSDGIAEELLNLLAKIPELRVISRSSAFSFKGKDLPLTEIAQHLNVAHILEGSVRKAGNRVRITAQLIDARSDTHLWSETYDRELDDIFAIQDDIAATVVAQLKITLLGEAPKVAETDPEAYQLFLEGLYLKRQLSRDSLQKAIDAFNRAVEIDPSYAPAWAELADTYLWGGGSEKLSRKERAALADQAIERAISIDPDYAFAYYVRGISWIFTKRNFDRAIEDFEHALELEPDNAFMIAAIGKHAVVTGKFDRAITQFQAALALEPVVPEFHWYLGRAYLGFGRLDKAEASFRKTLDLSPTAYGNHELWETLFLKGELEAALAQAELLDYSTYALAVTHFALGDWGKADEYLSELIELDAAFSIAKVYAHRGEADKTFKWLNYAWERQNYIPVFILSEAALRSVYADPRWPLFLEELGLIEFWLEMSPRQRP
jgi:adenylate cyclase